jgi:hypothetical protein
MLLEATVLQWLRNLEKEIQNIKISKALIIRVCWRNITYPCITHMKVFKPYTLRTYDRRISKFSYEKIMLLDYQTLKGSSIAPRLGGRRPLPVTWLWRHRRRDAQCKQTPSPSPGG